MLNARTDQVIAAGPMRPTLPLNLTAGLRTPVLTSAKPVRTPPARASPGRPAYDETAKDRLRSDVIHPIHEVAALRREGDPFRW